jgi:hypothetical protein
MLISRLFAATMVAGSAEPHASIDSSTADTQPTPAGRKDVPARPATSVAR